MTKKTIAIEEPTHDRFIMAQLRASIKTHRKLSADSFLNLVLATWEENSL